MTMADMESVSIIIKIEPVDDEMAADERQNPVKKEAPDYEESKARPMEKFKIAKKEIFIKKEPDLKCKEIKIKKEQTGEEEVLIEAELSVEATEPESLLSNVKSETFACDLCSKEFDSEHLLESHLHSHTLTANPQKRKSRIPTPCRKCGRLIARQNLKQHMKVHTENKIDCSLCGKIFSETSMLLLHMHTHTEEKSYARNIRNRSFSLPETLKAHMSTLTDTERVIMKVQQHPVLWNKKNELYKNKEARDAAWKQILMDLAPNYEGLSEAEKIYADKKIQQRWRTARDTYRKEKIYFKYLPSGSGSKKKKRKYSFFDMLTFLDNSTRTDVDETLSETLSDDANLDRFADVQAENSQQDGLRTTQHRKRKSVFDTQLLDSLSSSQLELESEDLAFFESLQPSLQRFTRYQKLQFRTKVLNIVMDMESQIQNNTYYNPSSSSFSNYENMSP